MAACFARVWRFSRRSAVVSSMRTGRYVFSPPLLFYAPSIKYPTRSSITKRRKLPAKQSHVYLTIVILSLVDRGKKYIYIYIRNHVFSRNDARKRRPVLRVYLSKDALQTFSWQEKRVRGEGEQAGRGRGEQAFGEHRDREEYETTSGYVTRVTRKAVVRGCISSK